MADINHNAISDPYIHEPKGVSTATSGQVYKANGSGSGAWTSNINKYTLTVTLPDVSAASSAYVVAPIAGTLKRIDSVLGGAITLANSAMSFTIAGVAVTGSAQTIAFSGSGAGVAFSSTPSAANTVTAGQVIAATSDGGSTTTQPLTITYTIEV